tara:strand:- start:356 stop:1087 length:732 start_codon:yes stop_codon:yes gene_type:complete
MTFRHATVVRLCILTLLSASLASSSLLADGLIHKLPEDGTRVTYKTEFKSTPAPPPGFKATVTLSSVGKVMHEGKACRWMELAFITEFNESKRAQYFKLLIPEDQLKKGGDPLTKMVKSYEQHGNGETKKTTREATADPVKGPLPLLFGGPLENVKPLEKTTLKTGLGDLECTGNSGTYSKKKDDATFTANIQSLAHENVPFGVAQLAIEFNLKEGEREQKGSLTLTVEKVSTGVTSELPDSK